MDDDVDRELLALQASLHGNAFATAAIALALIDKGLVDKNRLLDIIESLRTLLALDYEDRLAEAADTEWALDEVSQLLELQEWRAGRVVEDLRTRESEGFLVSRSRRASGRRGRPDDPTDTS